MTLMMCQIFMFGQTSLGNLDYNLALARQQSEQTQSQSAIYGIIGVISAVISLIVLIVFFCMAANLSTVKSCIKELRDNETRKSQKLGYGDAFRQGELYEFLRNPKKALGYYLEAYFLLHKRPTTTDWTPQERESEQKIIAKIELLGGDEYLNQKI